MQARAFGADAADAIPFRVRRWSALSARNCQAIFGARGEHAIRLADAARHEIVDHDADISLRAIEDDFAALAGQRCRIETGQKSLCRSLFIAGGAVDLSGQKQVRAIVSFAASASSSRGST